MLGKGGFGLSPFGQLIVWKKWLKAPAFATPAFDRVRKHFMHLLNNRRGTPPTPHQRGCPEILPGLRAMPFWDASQFAWARKLQANVGAIKAELLALRHRQHARAHFQQYRAPHWGGGVEKAGDAGDKDDVSRAAWRRTPVVAVVGSDSFRSLNSSAVKSA